MPDAGGAAPGGVVALVGDDHTCESSTTCHQSEYALVDAMMPVLHPADISEIVDFGMHGWALSRFAGLWVGLKCVKDNVESNASVALPPDRPAPVLPKAALPEGARGYAGIGCHWMSQMMDRSTEGYTHMGGEGGNWFGEAPFSSRSHVFQNLGDGTYNHSGLMAVRAAIAAGVNITYKIFYSDAVAMTGGQSHEGGLGPGQIIAELRAAGVTRLEVVSDDPKAVDHADLPGELTVHHRGNLQSVRGELARVRVSRHWFTSKPAPPKNAAGASAERCPIPIAAWRFIQRSAKVAAIAVCKATVSRSCRWARHWAASAPSTKALATRISRASGGGSFVTVEGGKLRKPTGHKAVDAELPAPGPMLTLDRPVSIPLPGLVASGW
nr:hypothetical protein [Mameliella sediminis]